MGINFLQTVQKSTRAHWASWKRLVLLIMQMPFARDIFYFGQDDPHYYFYYVKHKTVYLF